MSQHLEVERQIPIFMAGLPGKMATLVAEAIEARSDFDLLPVAMSSRRHNLTSVEVGNRRIRLIDHCPAGLAPGRVAIDFTTPSAAGLNTIDYTHLRIPFVMGTSGGNREEMEAAVRESRTCAVIAANMDPQIIRQQIAIDQLAQNNPGIFNLARVEITESHQASKRDTSGTAIAFRDQFLGYGARSVEIDSIRNTQYQEEVLGILDPESGHAYHWVTVRRPIVDEIIYEFTTAVQGRTSYVEGTLMAVRFLDRQIQQGVEGQVFSMRDVLEGGEN